jgi:ankyrin repeat protein
MMKSTRDLELAALVHAISEGDIVAAKRLLDTSPELATASFVEGATRQSPKAYYAGDTALHIAASLYETEIVRKLLAMGADVRSRNRRGAEPLHSAAVGQPGSSTWNPAAQAAVIAILIKVGADPNAIAKGGVTPLHRAVRTRCAAAVKALLDGGADALAPNENGSTAMLLATRNTGRGGSGSPQAREQQQEILRQLKQHGARRP